MSERPAGAVVPFRDRRDAGRILAGQLCDYANRRDVVVLALPRGGVPVAFEVARALRVPLDVFVVRKLGVPGQEELAMGAIASGGVRDVNEDVVHILKISRDIFEAVAQKEEHEVLRRENEYRDGREAQEVRGRTVLLVDDGLATGSSMRVALAALRKKGPGKIIVAVPVAPRETCLELETLADEVVCGIMPEPFRAVGEWYEDFSQTTDDEVRELLKQLPTASARDTSS